MYGDQQGCALDTPYTLVQVHNPIAGELHFCEQCYREHFVSVPLELMLVHATKLCERDLAISGVPRNFVQGGVQQIQLRTEATGSAGGSPLVRGSGGSCNLVQEISFHIVKFS